MSHHASRHGVCAVQTKAKLLQMHCKRPPPVLEVLPWKDRIRLALHSAKRCVHSAERGHVSLLAFEEWRTLKVCQNQNHTRFTFMYFLGSCVNFGRRTLRGYYTAVSWYRAILRRGTRRFRTSGESNSNISNGNSARSSSFRAVCHLYI